MGSVLRRPGPGRRRDHCGAGAQVAQGFGALAGERGDAVGADQPVEQGRGASRSVSWLGSACSVGCGPGQDRTWPAGLDDLFAARCSQHMSLPTSHSPFLSRPDEIAAHIQELL
ncbi:MAG TPA: hypothetical protein VGJ13_11055 [Pseudonocardiaceae bacterium]